MKANEGMDEMVPAMCIYIENKYFWGGGVIETYSRKGVGCKQIRNYTPFQRMFPLKNYRKRQEQQ